MRGGRGIENDFVGFTVGRVRGVDTADVRLIGVVERVRLRDVGACFGIVGEVACATEVEEDGFTGRG